PSAAGQSVPSVSTGSSSGSGKPLTCRSRSTRTCFAMPVGSSSPTMATTRAPCRTTSGTRTFRRRSDTPKWRPTDSRTFGGADDDGGPTSPCGLLQLAARRSVTEHHVPTDDGTRFLGLRSCGPIAVSTSIISRFGLRFDDSFSEDCPPGAGSAAGSAFISTGARSQPLEPPLKSPLPGGTARLFDHLVSTRHSPNGSYGTLVRVTASVCFDVRRPDHLAPLLGFSGDEPAEVGNRAWKCGGAPLGKPRVRLGIGKGRVDLRVELVHDLGWRVARRADAGPKAKLIARHKFGNRRPVRQHRRACRDGYCQRAKFAGPDVFDR